MTQSLFGSNVDLPYVRDYGRFLEYHRQLDPAAMTLIVDKPDQTEKLKAAAHDLPNATVIARVWHPDDGGFFLPPSGPGDTRPEISGAEAYVDAYADLGQGNMILSLLNEPSAFNALNSQVKLVSWCVRAMQHAATLPKPPRLCLPNWADRNPFVKGGQWAPAPDFADAPDELYDPLLMEAAKHPERVSIGLHLYGPDAYSDTLAGLVGRCSILGIRCPDVYISEWGLDTEFPGDVKNGYKTRMPGENFANWHWVQITVGTPLRSYVEAGIVKGVTTFGYGHTERWIAYDTETDRPFQITMLRLKEEGKLSIPAQVLAQSVAKPADPGPGRKVICRKFRNIRSGPSTRYHDDGDLAEGAVCTVYDQHPQPEKLADNSIVNWWWMESDSGDGWIQSTGWKWENVPEPAPAPVDVPPVETWPVPPPAPQPDTTVKEWTFGLRIKGTQEQKDLMIRGIEQLILGCAIIGAAAGVEAAVVAREA